MLIDEYLPQYDVRERHHLRVAATPEIAYRALTEADFGRAGITRALLVMRALPGLFARRASGVDELRARASAPITLDTFEAHGFRRLDAAPPGELVLGLEGRFWQPTGGLRTPEPDAFRALPPAPGCARGVWNFTIVPGDNDSCVVATETRVLCADAAARRRFFPYWYVIRPASGLIRRLMLRAIRHAAEQPSPHAPRDGAAA